MRVQERAWLTIMPCLHGHIYPHGGTTLAVSTDKSGSVAGKLRRLPCTTPHQVSDADGCTFLFDVSDFRKVAQFIKPRRRRQMTPEQKQEAADRIRKYRFQTARESPRSEQKRAPAPSGV